MQFSIQNQPKLKTKHEQLFLKFDPDCGPRQVTEHAVGKHDSGAQLFQEFRLLLTRAACLRNGFDIRLFVCLFRRF